MKRSIGVASLSAVLAIAAAFAPAGALARQTLRVSPRAAATPPAVLVRIEGTSSALLPQTLVQTTSSAKVRGQVCPGTSAAGALDDATARAWTGSYDAKFKDFLVSSILGESPASNTNNFWTLWINGRSSSTGACSTPLHAGDHELWFDCVADANFNCTNDPLVVTGPTTARAGRALTLTVGQLDGSGHSAPVAGAAVTANGIAGVSGPNGTARVVPRHTGVISIQAAKSGATPSDLAYVCVYSRSRSACASQSAGPPVHIRGIREHAVFTGRGPQILRGTAGPDPYGITDVQLRLLRTVGGHCSYYAAAHGAWHVRRCGTVPAGASFSVGASQSWSYLLPRALKVGAYRLEAVATDGRNRRSALVTGSSVIDFEVRR